MPCVSCVEFMMVNERKGYRNAARMLFYVVPLSHGVRNIVSIFQVKKLRHRLIKLSDQITQLASMRSHFFSQFIGIKNILSWNKFYFIRICQKGYKEIEQLLLNLTRKHVLR